MAIKWKSKPKAIPIAAAYQILAAVVRLEILFVDSLLKMTPAPKNPTPATIWEAIRVGSSPPTSREIKVKVIAAAITNVWVLMPAGLPLSSRSIPIIRPATKARDKEII